MGCTAAAVERMEVLMPHHLCWMLRLTALAAALPAQQQQQDKGLMILSCCYLQSGEALSSRYGRLIQEQYSPKANLPVGAEVLVCL